QATFVCLLLPVLFVGLIYAWPGSFKWTSDDRDIPANMRKRLASVAVACFLSFLVCLFFVDAPASFGSVWQTLGALGVLKDPMTQVYSTAFALLNILILFGGPIIAEHTRTDKTVRHFFLLSP
ncbi:MAG: hypothetical protein K2X36_09160, partial [Microbacteriaceae bacterium]|nr:hypothetical protein [Microbacteriaceae bacterium]